jgi:Family of unknown function (DUF5990)
MATALSHEQVRFRLLRRDDVPATNPDKLVFRFGLQDTKGNIMSPDKRSDGMLIVDFTLKVKPGKDGRPVFLGPFASGPVEDRFVYLSWWAIERKDYINRVKARLAEIDWKMIRESVERQQAITADVTGRSPGAGKTPIHWYLE